MYVYGFHVECLVKYYAYKNHFNSGNSQVFRHNCNENNNNKLKEKKITLAFNKEEKEKIII